MDVAIPIVFPDYKIAYPIEVPEIDLFKDWTWDNVKKSTIETRWSYLGHAGVLFIQGKTGVTKYYEYGRYVTPVGKVVKRSVPNALSKDGKIVKDSLKKVLHEIAVVAGHHGRIEAVYIEVEGGYEKMLKYAQLRYVENSNPKRKAYSITEYNCVHFAKDVVAAAGVQTPWSLDPRPNAYIGEFRDEFPDLDYDPKTGQLKLETAEENEEEKNSWF